MSKNLTCYKGDGSISPDIPCGFTSSSHCCGEGWDCLTNGLCRNHGTTAYSQGSCTDPSFINCLAFCNGAEFESFTEVSRCGSNSNSWCCAGAAGQSLGGVDCCTTNSTTPLEPYPLSTIEGSKTSKTTLRSIGSATTEHATSSLKPTLLQTSIFGSATSSPTSAGLPSSAPRVVRDHDSKLGIKIGVPIAVVIIFLLAFLAFFIRRRNRSHKPGAAALHEKSTDERSNLKPELEGNSAMELDVTHYELSHSEPPRHELG